MTTTEKPWPRWWFPGASRKAHLFSPDGRSLCGKWAKFGSQDDDDPFLVSKKRGPDDCAECDRRARFAHAASRAADQGKGG